MDPLKELQAISKPLKEEEPRRRKKERPLPEDLTSISRPVEEEIDSSDPLSELQNLSRPVEEGGEDDGFFEGLGRGIKQELTPFNLSDEDKEALRRDRSWSTIAGEMIGNIGTSIAAASGSAALGAKAGAVAGPIGALVGAGVGTLGYALYSGFGQEAIASAVTGKEASTARALGRVALTVNPIARMSGKAVSMIKAAQTVKPGIAAVAKIANKAETPAALVARAAAQVAGEGMISSDLYGEQAGAIGAGVTLLVSPILFRRMSSPPSVQVSQNIDEFFDSPVGHDLATKIAKRIETEVPETVKLTKKKLNNEKFLDYVLTRPGGGESFDALKEMSFRQKSAKFKRLRSLSPDQGGYSDEQIQELYKAYLGHNIAKNEMKKTLENVRGEFGVEVGIAGNKAEAKKVLSEGDPLSKMEALLLDGQYVGRAVDRAMGDNLTQVLNEVSEQGSTYVGHQMALVNKGLDAIKATKDAKLTLTDMGRLKAFLSEKDKSMLTPALEKLIGPKGEILDDGVRKAVNLWSDAFESARGVIESYGFKIGKLPDYIPMKTKDRIALATEIRRGVAKLRGLANAAGYDDFMNLNEAGLERIGLKGKDLIQTTRYVDNLRSFMRRRLNIPKEQVSQKYVMDLVDSLVKPNEAKGFSTDISALFTREGLPLSEKFRELDIGKAFLGYLQGNVRSAVMNPILRKLADKADVYRAAGFTTTSQWMDNLLIDLTVGKAKGRVKLHDMVTASYDNFRYQMAKTLDSMGVSEDSTIGKVADALPDFVAKWQAGLYPAYLGMNLRALVRNMQQNYAVTAPELGGAYGYVSVSKGFLEAFKTAKKQPGGVYQNLKKIMQDLGLGSEGGIRGEAFRESAIPVGEGGRLLKDINDKAMALYSSTDVINRAATYFTGKVIARDLIKGSPEAIEALKNMGNATKAVLRAKGIQKMIQEGNEEALGDLLGRTMIAKTQFHYGIEQRAEFLRTLGPFFSMFTKWPMSVSSNIYDVWKENPKFAKKMARYWGVYGAPYAALSAMTYGANETFGEEGLYQYLVGDLKQSSPLDSVKSFIGQESVVQSPFFEFATKIMDPEGIEDFDQWVKTKGKHILKTSMPPLSSIVNEIERFEKKTTGTRLTTIDDIIGRD